MFRTCIILIFITLSGSLSAQQLPIYSQYMMNEFLLNPAVAGVDGRTSLNLTGRKQWIGFKNPPETYSFSAQARILKKRFAIRGGSISKGTKGRVGVGVNVFNDQNGAINRTGLQFSYAYHIFINNYNNQISFGLTASAFQFKIDDNAEFRDPDDPLQPYIGKSAIIPDASAGFNIQGNNYHAGLVVSQLFQSRFKIGEISVNQQDVQVLRHYYILGSYRYAFPGRSSWETEPSFVILLNENLGFQADISTRMIYKKEYWAGLSVRTTGELIALLGLKYRNLYFGYSFDYGFNGISKLTYGSHEINIAIKFGSSVRRYRWLERY